MQSMNQQRTGARGADNGLTELSAYQPAAPQNDAQDSYEKEEAAAKLRKTSVGAGSEQESNDDFLTEQAVPKPVNRHQSNSENGNASHTVSPNLQGAYGDEEQPQNQWEEKTPVPSTRESTVVQTVWHEIVSVGWLIFFSILGVLARLGIEALTTYPYAPFPSTVLWANMGGSLVMGFLLEDRQIFRNAVEPHLLQKGREEAHKHIDKRKKALPLYVGLSVGFCGSFTSFSTFITDAFLSLSNSLAPASSTSPYHKISSTSIESRNGGYSFMAVVAILLIQPALSMCALKTGAHIALGLEKFLPTLPPRMFSTTLDMVSVILGYGCWLGSVFLCIWPVATNWRYDATFACVFAPLGALSRYYFSKHLNGRVASFPLGTFSINILGTCIAGMCYDLQHARTIIGRVSSKSANSCAVLEGVIQGYCGCATTVSTWVAELNGLRRRHGWIYGLTSVGVALAFQICIMGSMGWTIGFSQNCA